MRMGVGIGLGIAVGAGIGIGVETGDGTRHRYGPNYQTNTASRDVEPWTHLAFPTNDDPSDKMHMGPRLIQRTVNQLLLSDQSKNGE